MLVTGIWDGETVEIIRRFVGSGHICMDVGANVGSLSLALAQRTGSMGKVFAFEPGPLLARRFQRNVQFNPRFHDIIILNEVGLSDKEGKLFWNEDMENRGNAGLLGRSGQQVDVTTVDRFVQSNCLQKLDFVKIDVEGMEFEVLSGGLETWQRFEPILYFETMHAVESILKKPLFRNIQGMLQAIGYTLYKYSNGELFEASSSDHNYNTIALPSGSKSLRGF